MGSHEVFRSYASPSEWAKRLRHAEGLHLSWRTLPNHLYNVVHTSWRRNGTSAMAVSEGKRRLQGQAQGFAPRPHESEMQTGQTALSGQKTDQSTSRILPTKAKPHASGRFDGFITGPFCNAVTLCRLQNSILRACTMMQSCRLGANGLHSRICRCRSQMIDSLLQMYYAITSISFLCCRRISRC